MTRDEIMTLAAAGEAFVLDRATRAALQTRLRKKALHHLGWQENRGWFYRVTDIHAALNRIEGERRRARLLRAERRRAA